MKKKVFWSFAAALTLSILVAWLYIVLGRQVLSFALLLVAAFSLGWINPTWSLLLGLILTAGIPLLHLIGVNLDLGTSPPFSWVGTVILPVLFCLPPALFGGAFGWMHNIVKDDF